MSRATALVLCLLNGALGPGPAEAQEPSPSPHIPPEWAAALGAVLDYDKAPKPVHMLRPRYPQDAFERKIEGVVVIEILIDATGRVSATHVVKSISALDEAAVACVAGWTFEPAVKDGRPVATVARAPVTFRIVGGPPPDSQSSMWDGKDGRELLVTGLDAKGPGFGEWIDQFEAEVFGHWALPELLRSGPRRVVALELAIEKDGSVSKVRRVLPDTKKMTDAALVDLDGSAQKAVRASRLPVLPLGYKPSRVKLTVSFIARGPSAPKQ